MEHSYLGCTVHIDIPRFSVPALLGLFLYLSALSISIKFYGTAGVVVMLVLAHGLFSLISGLDDAGRQRTEGAMATHSDQKRSDI